MVKSDGFIVPPFELVMFIETIRVPLPTAALSAELVGAGLVNDLNDDDGAAAVCMHSVF